MSDSQSQPIETQDNNLEIVDVDVEMSVEVEPGSPSSNTPGTQMESQANSNLGDPPQPKQRSKKDLAAEVAAVREEGKSLLPFSRVQKIIKADKDIPIMAREATHLISLATEEFIKRLCEAGYRVAERERRTTVQLRDLASVVRRADEFFFLDEIIRYSGPDATAKRVPKAAQAQMQAQAQVQAAPTMLDQFVGKTAPPDSGSEIATNADGTMLSVEPETQDDEALSVA